MKRKKKKARKTESRLAKNAKLLKKRYPHLWQSINDRIQSVGAVRDASVQTDATARLQQSKALFYGNVPPAQAVKKMIAGWAYQPYDVLFLVGMGLGYLPMELASNQNVGNPRLIIIEPSVQLFCDALEHMDLRHLIANDRIDLFVGQTVAIPEIVSRFKESICIGKSPVLIHPAYETLFGDTIRSLKNGLSDHIREAKGTWHTVKTHGQRMFANNIANLPSLFAGSPMRQLKGRFDGMPAICVAAGPSLDDAVEDLKQVGNRALIIACDSAINALYHARIKPHIVVTIDYQEINVDKLKPYLEFLSDAVLIFGLEANPDNVRLSLGSRRVGVTAFSKLMSFWLDPQLALEGLFPDMTSVSHMALFSAVAMKADPIVLVGMDLAYQHGKSHSSSSPFFHSLDDKKPVSVYGNTGRSLPSDQPFINDRLLIESIAGDDHSRWINTSLNGAYIDGTQVKGVAEVMAVNVPAEADVNAVLDAIDWSCAADESRARSELAVFVQLLETVRSTCVQRKKFLSTAIESLRHRSPNAKDRQQCVDAEKKFATFEKEHLAYKSMVLEVMLDDVAEVARQREVLSVKASNGQIHLVEDRLRLLHREYDVLEAGLGLKIEAIRRVIDYLASLDRMKNADTHAHGNEDLSIQLAALYRQNGEIWQAVREYRACMTTCPDNIQPFLELMQTCMDADLLASAQSVLNTVKRHFDDSADVAEMDAKFQQRVDALFEKMKAEWMQGNIQATRKLLYEYLILRPEDPQAGELKQVIGRLDREFARKWAEKQEDRVEMADVAARSRQVVDLVKQRLLEKAVGMLEGLYQDVPQNRAAIREQIGDMRMLQQDFASAIWNYTQALELAPMNVAIQGKIDRVRQLHPGASALP